MLRRRARTRIRGFRRRRALQQGWQHVDSLRPPVPRGLTVWVVPAALTAVLVLALTVAALQQREGDSTGWLDLLSGHPARVHAALTALVVTTFIAFYVPRRRQARSFTVVAGAALGVVAVLLGLASYLPCSGEEVAFFSPVTWTLGLFFGSRQDVWSEGACSGTPPVAASVAYLSALLTTTVGFGAVLAAATRDQWDRLRVRLARSVVVVAGLDDVTLPVVMALKEKVPGDTLVVIDPDAAHPGARRARAAGARVVTGELADPSTARSVLVRRARLKARAVYLISPDRTVNLERLATLVVHLATDRRLDPRADGALCRAVVRVDDPWQVEDHRRTALDARYEPWVLEAVSIFETTARGVVDRLTSAAADRLLVVGSTPLTLALLAELARRERESSSIAALEVTAEVVGPPLPARITVLSPDADELLQDHVHQQGRFGNLAASAFEAVVGEVSAKDVEAVVGQDTWFVVFTAPASSESALVAARVAARHPVCTIEVLAESSSHSAEAVAGQRPRPMALSLIQPDGRLSDDTWEHVARLVHERHRLSFPAGSSGHASPSRRPWEQLPPFYRESGLRQIRKVLEAVAAEGRSWGPASDSEGEVELTENELDRISAAEHQSWREYYEQNGWRPLAAGQPRDHTGAAKRHPMLKSWDTLTEEEQQRTHRGVQRTVHLLRTLGYRPVVVRQDDRVG